MFILIFPIIIQKQSPSFICLLSFMSPTMLEIAKAWYLFSFSLGCWTCLNLLANRRGDRAIKLCMVAFITLLLVPSLNAYVTLAMHGQVDWLFTLSHQLTWGYGPLMVILIQHSVLKKTRTITLALHATPFVFAALIALLNFSWVNPLWMLLILFVQVLSYLIYAVFLLKKNRHRLLRLAKQHKNTTYYWLLYLVAGLMFVILFDFSIIIGIYCQFFSPSLLVSAVASILAIYVNSIALFALHQPEVFFHETDVEEIETVAIKQNFRVIELSAVAANELDEQLQQLIKTHKPHLDENISLNKLASLLGVTSHQLSELLNIHKATSFYDFLNDLRYQESLQLFSQQDTDLTIADVAYQSGFNNRNSFYKVFKEKTGITPSQYRKTAQGRS